MEIGKIYVIDNEYKNKTIYRLEKYELVMESFEQGYFWYKNKFGEGFTYKHEKDIRLMVLADEGYQILYGEK